MFHFASLTDADLAAEYTLFNADAFRLLRHYGPAALAMDEYQRVERILSDITAEQQRRAHAARKAA